LRIALNPRLAVQSVVTIPKDSKPPLRSRNRAMIAGSKAAMMLLGTIGAK
jgi:hypothetical protein